MKRILVLCLLALSFVGLKAQVYYYVKAGGDPTSSWTECIVIRWENSGKKILQIETSVKGIKSCLLNNTNYFENLKASEDRGHLYSVGNYRYYNFKNSQSNMNIFHSSTLISEGAYFPPVTANGKGIYLEPNYDHFYLAISFDMKNLIKNPEGSEESDGIFSKQKKYYKQVPKSTFEFQGMNF